MSSLYLNEVTYSFTLFLDLFLYWQRLREEGVLVANSPNFHLAGIFTTFIMPEALQSEGDIMERTSSPLILCDVHLKKLPNAYSSELERT